MMDGGSGAAHAAASSGSGDALAYAEQGASLPPQLAEAYASILKKPFGARSLAPRWGVWGTAYGGSNWAGGSATTAPTI
jgi:hypothetical protein